MLARKYILSVSLTPVAMLSDQVLKSNQSCFDFVLTSVTLLFPVLWPLTYAFSLITSQANIVSFPLPVRLRSKRVNLIKLLLFAFLVLLNFPLVLNLFLKVCIIQLFPFRYTIRNYPCAIWRFVSPWNIRLERRNTLLSSLFALGMITISWTIEFFPR